jgi:hypothetical protein
MTISDIRSFTTSTLMMETAISKMFVFSSTSDESCLFVCYLKTMLIWRQYSVDDKTDQWICVSLRNENWMGKRNYSQETCSGAKKKQNTLPCSRIQLSDIVDTKAHQWIRPYVMSLTYYLHLTPCKTWHSSCNFFFGPAFFNLHD